MKHALLLALFIAHIGVAQTNYVALDGLHIPPFTNWLTAATNIQDAVDVARDGDVVLVSSGVYCTGGAVTPGYTLMNRVCVTNALWLKAVYGADVTFIVGAPDAETGGSGSNALRGVYLSNGAVLEGFSVTGGYTQIEGTQVPVRGGGMYVADMATVLTCRVAYNHAQQLGGGVHGYRAVLAAVECVSNVSAAGGGGMAVLACSVVNCTTLYNRCSTLGGGIYATGSYFNGLMSANNSSQYGGGLYVRFCRISSASILNNTVGGGLELDDAIVSDSRISNNLGVQVGGGVFAMNKSKMSNCHVVQCEAQEYAGGVYITGGSLIEDSVVEANRCGLNGGGVYSYGDGVMSNVLVVGNAAGRYGGGVYMYAGGAVSNCVIRGNTAGGDVYSGAGGGVCLQNGGNVYNSVIEDNRVNAAMGGEMALGAGAYLWAGGGLHNCLIVSNWASDRNSGGGGVACTAGGGVVNNCTIMHNEGRENGGGVLGGAVIRNSIVFYNRSFGALEHDGAQMEYSCTRPLPAGAGNITNAPLLMADYQQVPDSPTVNAGSNAYAAGLWDLAGTNRILFGTVDMGCYECPVPEPGAVAIALGFTIYDLRITNWGKRKGGKKERSDA